MMEAFDLTEVTVVKVSVGQRLLSPLLSESAFLNIVSMR